MSSEGGKILGVDKRCPERASNACALAGGSWRSRVSDSRCWEHSAEV